MAYMQKIMTGIKTDHLLAELNEHPELWNRYTMRTRMFDKSPHRECSDLWIRYNDWSNFDPEYPDNFAKEHESVWYSSYFILTELRKVVDSVIVLCGINEVGGILLTRIPAGKSVKMHSDAGHWHSEYYKDKLLLLLKSKEGQSFNFSNGERHEGESGDLFSFSNLTPHEVINSSDEDRISLIITGRKD